MNLTQLKMRHQTEKLGKAINRKVNRALRPRSADHVHLIEDHMESMKSPKGLKSTPMKRKSVTQGNTNKISTPRVSSGDHAWGRKGIIAAQQEKQVKTGRIDQLRAQLKDKIQLLQNRRTSKSGKTPQKKSRESKKVRREKNRNKSGLGSARSDSKNQHKLLKLAASKVSNNMTNHQLLVSDTDSD